MKKLLNLIKNNADKKRDFKIQNMGDDTTVIYIYDVIDPYWGVSAESFVKELSTVNSANITLHINSPGGDVFDARAIATAIKQHPANVTAKIDGLAASAATYIALAADKVEMAEGSFFMIHKGWTFAMGNADELRETSNLLDKVDESIVNDYAKKTGIESEEIISLMAAETWFNAKEALERGFVDEITDGEAVNNRFDLSAYDNAPKIESNQFSDHRAALDRRVALYERGI